MGPVTGDGGGRCQSGSDVSINQETTRGFLISFKRHNATRSDNLRTQRCFQACEQNSNRHRYKVSVFRGRYFRPRLLDRTWSEHVSCQESDMSETSGGISVFQPLFVGFSMCTNCSRAVWLKIANGALCTSHPSFRANWHYEELTYTKTNATVSSNCGTDGFQASFCECDAGYVEAVLRHVATAF